MKTRSSAAERSDRLAKKTFASVNLAMSKYFILAVSPLAALGRPPGACLLPHTSSRAFIHFVQNRNVKLTTRILAAAIIRISVPSKSLKARNIGALMVPDAPN